jgi:glycosyltransferase involved in cell wall biosynthesis
MKVLYVTDALAIWGGMERVLVEKANYLATHGGYEVFMLTVCQGNHPFPFPLDSQVTHVDLNIPFHAQYQYFGIRRIWMLRQLHHDLRAKFQIQLMHIQPNVIVCPRIEFVMDICKVKGDIPLIFESHSSFWTSRFEKAGFMRRLHIWWMNLSAKKAQVVVALTEGDAEEWRRVNSRVYVIPDVVHLNGSGCSCNPQTKSVVYVGRLSRQKNLGGLLAIWHVVRQRHFDWQLEIYGEKDDIEDSLWQQLQEDGNGVTVHPPTKDILDIYRQHAILLLTSHYQPFGMVLPEAMSCGLPVVAFDCPYGPGDIITDGVDGFLIKDRNTNDFADKVCLLIEDPDMRRQMGEAAILSSQRYQADRIMPFWHKLFNLFGTKQILGQ